MGGLAGGRWAGGIGRRKGSGGGASGRRGGTRHRGGGLAFNGEAAGGLPGEVDEDLYFIFTGHPTPGLGVPITVAKTAGASIPWAGLVINQLISIEP